MYATCHYSFISTLQVENFFLADKSDHIFHTRELKHLQVELVILWFYRYNVSNSKVVISCEFVESDWWH